MAKYTRQPVPVEANRYMPGQPLPKGVEISNTGNRPYAFIKGPRGGEAKVYEGDWIVECRAGEFERVSNEAFTKEFTKAEGCDGCEDDKPAADAPPKLEAANAGPVVGTVDVPHGSQHHDPKVQQHTT